MRLVHVVWVDSMVLNDGGWLHVDEASVAWEELEQESIGFVVREDERVMVLAQSRNRGSGENDGTRVCGVQVIPRSAVLNVIGISDSGEPRAYPHATAQECFAAGCGCCAP